MAAEAAESPFMYFDISQSSRKLAAAAGAVDTDRYCPLKHLARLAGDQATFDYIARV
jgi:hypothetical protein